MEWAEEFYSKQAAWSGIYTSDVSDYHRGKASLLQALAGDSPKTVLELGAGGAQAAFATAELGYHVTAIELLPTSAAHAMTLSTRTRRGSLRVVQGDFYAVQADGPYDIVCYWDGFGIGQDEDQARLLRRMARWLNRSGVVLLDIYSPWYWAKVAGRQMVFDTVMRRYGFDPAGNRMTVGGPSAARKTASPNPCGAIRRPISSFYCAARDCASSRMPQFRVGPWITTEGRTRNTWN